MPEEKAPATPASPSFRAQFESLILDPYRLLVIGVWVLLIGGLLLGIVDLIAWSDDVDVFLMYTFFTVVPLSVVIGIIAVIHGVRQRKGAAPDAAPKDLKQALTNPVWLLSIAPDAVLVVGGLNLLFFLIYNWRIGAVDVFGGIFDLLFRVSFAFFMVLTLKFVSDWLHGTERAAPAVAEGATPTLKDRYWQFVRNPDQFLFFGLLLTIYLALLETIFEVWDRWDGDVPALWLQFIHQIAVIAGAAAFLIIARSIVNWLRGAEAPGGGLARGAGEQFLAWMRRITANPLLAVNAVLLLAVVGGLPFFVTDLWDFRNTPVGVFWTLMLENSLYGLSIIGSLLVLRAFAIHLVNGSGSYSERLAGASNAVFYDNPAWLLRFLVYTIPIVGLTFLSLEVWDSRGDGFWRVWYWFFLIGGEMLVPLVIFIGARALYAEAWSEAPAALASADGATPQPVTAGASPSGSAGTLA